MDTWRIKQVSCERDLSNTNFANGEIQYLLRMNPNQQINLDKSFIRARVKLSKANGNQLELGDGIAPNYLMAYGLFKQMYQHMDGKEIGSCRSYCSQTGALLHRQKYPQSYKDKFLATTNFAKIDFEERLNDVSVDGLEGGGSPKRQSVHMLNQANGTHLLGTETFAVANTITINYAGAIDLTETELTTGDKIIFNNLNGEIRTIVAITNNTIVIDGRGVDNFGAVAVGSDDFFYEKSGGKPSKRMQEFEIVFKPPLSCWNYDKWLPAHDMSLKLYPHPEGTWQLNCIQSLGVKTHGTDFQLEIQDMIMYCALKDEKHPDGEYSCQYEDLRCQLTNITTTSNVDHHFIVDRQSYGFTVSLIDENCENDSRRSCTQFKIRNDEELKLQRFYVQWNGRVLPDPYPQISKTSSKDFYTQRYYESIFYSGANENYDVESLDDWESAGPYYTVNFGKGRNQTEKVTVSTLFEDNAFENGHRPNLLLFDHFTRKFSMVVSGGKVREVHVDRVN